MKRHSPELLAGGWTIRNDRIKSHFCRGVAAFLSTAAEDLFRTSALHSATPTLELLRAASTSSRPVSDSGSSSPSGTGKSSALPFLIWTWVCRCQPSHWQLSAVCRVMAVAVWQSSGSLGPRSYQQRAASLVTAHTHTQVYSAEGAAASEYAFFPTRPAAYVASHAVHPDI